MGAEYSILSTHNKNLYHSTSYLDNELCFNSVLPSMLAWRARYAGLEELEV
jgi:hypothetical protein